MTFEQVSFWISLITGVLSLIVAVGFGVYALREARSQSTQLTENLRTSSQILSHLTTRHVGEFPDHLQSILSCIEGAKSEILIACDYPGYAVVSDYAWCMRYIGLLMAKYAQGAAVFVVFQREGGRIVPAEQQFGGTKEEWQKNLGQADFHQRIKFLQDRENVSINSVDEFHVRLRALQQEILTNRLQGIQNKRIFDGVMPIFCWIADRKSAVFSIPTVTDSQSNTVFSEHAFETQDERLIGSLASIFHSYYNSAVVVNREVHG
jgi:hypothetical protein